MTDRRTVDDLLTEWIDEDVASLEEPTIHPSHLVDYSFCPVCGKKYETRCRCRRSESQCSDGHHWHSCTLKEHKGIIVITDKNVHDLPGGVPSLDECTCGLGRAVRRS